ncbi:hypothetical protein A9K71_23190 [Mesorhizobium sp. WSM3873]|nr:hypothetical protein A9K71_23190 [Mesorhizobium sp. WSM3873]
MDPTVRRQQTRATVDLRFATQLWMESRAQLMSDEWKAFMAVGESVAKHVTLKLSSGEDVRDAVHVNSVEGFNARVRGPFAGVFHHIGPEQPT